MCFASCIFFVFSLSFSICCPLSTFSSLYLCQPLNRKGNIKMAKTFLYAFPFWRKIRSKITKNHATNAFLNTLALSFFALPSEYDFSTKTLYENDFLYSTIKWSSTYPFLCVAHICMFCVCKCECEFPFAWTKLLQFYLSWNYYYLQRPQLSARFSYMFAIKCERARVCLYHCWWSKTITFRFGCNPTYTFCGAQQQEQQHHQRRGKEIKLTKLNDFIAVWLLWPTNWVCFRKSFSFE